LSEKKFGFAKIVAIKSVISNCVARNEKLLSNLARDQKSLATPAINNRNILRSGRLLMTSLPQLVSLSVKDFIYIMYVRPNVKMEMGDGYQRLSNIT